MLCSMRRAHVGTQCIAFWYQATEPITFSLDLVLHLVDMYGGWFRFLPLWLYEIVLWELVCG